MLRREEVNHGNLFPCREPHVGKLDISKITKENKQDSVARVELEIQLGDLLI